MKQLKRAALKVRLKFLTKKHLLNYVHRFRNTKIMREPKN